MSRAIRRRARRALVASASAAVLVGGAVVTAPAGAAVADDGPGGGSLLLAESFAGASVDDPRVRPLGAACLTAAVPASTPATGLSALGPCVDGAVGPPVGVAPGYLALTDDAPTSSGAVALDRAVPASAGLVVELDAYQYQQRSAEGADGIGIVLVDGAYELAALGAWGGALGYAPSLETPGVSGGYLGIGLDVYGNFAFDDNGRGVGCAAASPYAAKQANSVTVRGPGHGHEGYCWLATAQLSSATQRLDVSDSWSPEAVVREAARRNVRVTVSPDEYPTVVVEIDFTGTRTAYQTVLTTTATEPAPATYKLGLVGATGALRDVHLVGEVEVRTVEPLGAVDLVTQVARDGAGEREYRTGDVVPLEYVVTNTEVEPLTDVVVTDPVVGEVCTVDELGPAGSATASATCTADVVVTAAHARAGEVVSEAAVTAVAAPGTTVSADAGVLRVPVVATAALAVEVTATVLGGAGEVARPGEQVGLGYLVTNTGEVDLDGVAVHEALGVPVTCPAGVLVPGADVTCTADEPYVVTDDDLLEPGTVVSTATATGTPPAHAAAPEPAVGRAVVPVRDWVAGLALEMHAEVVGSADGVADLGDRIRYAFTVTNTGELAEHDLWVEHPASGDDVVCQAETLAPGASTDCVARVEHVVSEDDLLAGSVRGVAVAHAHPEGRGDVPAPAEVVTPTRAPVAALDLGVVAAVDDPQGVAAPGSDVWFTFEVTSTGTVTVEDVAVAGLGLPPVVCEATVLAAGASTTCRTTAPYVVTEADAEAGAVELVATVSGTAPDGVVLEPVTRAVVVPVRAADPDPAPEPQPDPEPGPAPVDPPAGDTPAEEAPTAEDRLAATGATLVGALAAAIALLVTGVLVLRTRQPGDTDPST